ncbi:MAG TPA: recombinase family protein [Ktedonobacteraceae bacterium]|jgi:hypothetical protein
MTPEKPGLDSCQRPKTELSKMTSQGIYLGPAPFGYRFNREIGQFEVDRIEAAIVVRIFNLYLSGLHRTMKPLANRIKEEFNVRISSRNIRAILRDRFYLGEFTWKGMQYRGTHPIFLLPHQIDEIQMEMDRRGRS